MTMAMRGVVLALLVLRRVPGSHSPTVHIEGGLQNCPWAVPAWPLSLNSVIDRSRISLCSRCSRVSPNVTSKGPISPTIVACNQGTPERGRRDSD